MHGPQGKETYSDGTYFYGWYDHGKKKDGQWFNIKGEKINKPDKTNNFW